MNPRIGGVQPNERIWVGDSKIKSVVASTHPSAAIVFGFIAWSSAWLGLGHVPSLPVSGALIGAVMCIFMTIGLVNEVFDRDIDAIAKPWRAIPAGDVGVRWAVALALTSLALGIGLAALFSPGSAIVLAALAGVGAAYSARLKRTSLSWLPYVVGYPLVPVWAWVATGTFEPHALAIFGYAAPFVVAVHLCNQLRDFDDDAAAGVGGVVHRLGKPAAGTLCYALLALSPLPLMGAVLVTGQLACAALPLLAGVAHWSLMGPGYWGRWRDVQPGVYRRLFRRIQITGPVMFTSWRGLYPAPAVR